MLKNLLPNIPILNSLFILVAFTLGSVSGHSQINLDSGLVGFFKLDGNTADSSAQLIHGVSTNTLNTEGIHSLLNTGSSLNGSSSYISAGTSNRGVSNTITISVWVKTSTNSNNNECLVSKYNWGVNKGYLLKYRNGYPDIQGRNTSGSYISTSNTTMSISDGNWHHVMGVISNNSWEIWVDGTLASSATSLGTNTSVTNLYPTTIGAYYSQGARSMFYGGDLDEVRIYNRELLASEIGYLSNQKNNSTAQSIVSCNSYTSPWNGTLWNNTGSYFQINYGSDFADSLEIIHLLINAPDTSVLVSSDALRAVSDSNYSYQWIDCTNGLPIVNATDSVYTPIVSGNYAVVITNGSCIDTSSCHSYSMPIINLTSGLVGYFKLDGNVADSSVQLSHGTASNLTSTTGINCDTGSAFDFNGTNSKVVCGTGNRGISNTVNIGVWVKTTKSTDHQFLVEKYNWSVDRGFYLAIKNGIPLIGVRNMSGNGGHTWNANQTFLVSDGQWHHLFAKVSNNSLEMWVDGVLKASSTMNATTPDLTNSYNLNLGYYYKGSLVGNSNYFDGVMDEVRIYNRNLTPSELQALSNARFIQKHQSATACDSYLAPSGNSVWNTSGIYSDTVGSNCGVDTIYSVALNINGPDVNVTQIGDTLFAHSDSSYQYQWVECTSGLPIVGATGTEFVPFQSGSYAVVVSSGSCMDTSFCNSVTVPPISLSTGLVGYFKFDGNTADSSTQLSHGTPTSLTSTAGIQCVPNTAYDFNGTSSKVVAGTGSRGITHTVNISAWVKTTKSTDYQHIVEKYNWPSDRGYALAIKFGIPYVIARNSSGSGIHTWSAGQTFSVSDGQWHHLFARVSQNNLEIWVDGVLKATATQTASNPDLTTTKNLNIGYYNHGTSNPGYLDGSMDEVRLYNRDLTVNEIKALAESRVTYINSSATACTSYAAPSGNGNWNTSGIYTDTLNSSCGADTIYTVTLNINKPDVNVTQVGDSLYAVSNASYTYQWIDCVNGNMPIAGAQLSTFVPAESGTYAVEITSNGCIDTSLCRTVYIDDNNLPYVNAIFMDGVNNYLEIPNHTSLHSTTNLTLEAWIKPCSVTGVNMIYSKVWCSGNQNSYTFSVNDGKLRWIWYTGSCGSLNGVNEYISNAAIIQANTWQHISVVHSSTGVKLYLNGVEVGASLIRGSYGSLRSSTEPLRVGTYKNLSGTYQHKFSGQLDELRVWNQSISDSLILSRYNSPLLGTEPGLQGYYNMDNFTTGPNQMVPNNAVILGSVGNAITKGDSNYITPFYLNDVTSFILGEDTSLCAASAVTFDASIPSGSYSWQDGSTAATFLFSNGANLNNINVSYSNACVSTVDSVNVTVNPPFVVDLGNDTAICNPSNFILDAGNSWASFVWSNGSTGQTLTINQAGIYSVTVTDSCNTVIDSIHISGSLPTTFLTESRCGSYTSPSGRFVWNTTGVYHDTLVNAFGCDSVMEISLTVTPIPVTTINASHCFSYSPFGSAKTWYTTGTYYDTLQSAAGCDSVLLVNLTILPYEIINLTISSCQSYVSPSGLQTWSSSGTYSDLINHTNSCDTLYNIVLTINQNSNSTLTEVSCGNYISPSGKVWTSTGIYQDTIPNFSGCDSVITVDLTINNSSSVSITETTCGSYTWVSNGNTYWSSGIYTDTLTTSTGCDSINTLNLTINTGDTNTLITNSCDSFFWSVTGITYTQSGQYSQSFTNQNGCDSLEQLDLTINNSDSVIVQVQSCGAYLWSSTGLTYSSSGLYSTILSNVNGCDSIVVLDLSINLISDTTFMVSSCGDFVWNQNGMTYSHSGLYSDTVQNSMGCDSVINLDLEILLSSNETINELACGWYTSPDGMIYDSTGIYTAVIANSAGCDSTITINLQVTKTDTTVAQVADVLYAFANSNYQYQWIDCGNNTPIPGETDSIFHPSNNGTYAVEITNGSCFKTSSCVSVTNVALEELKSSKVSFYPNPVSDELTIRNLGTQSARYRGF